MGRNYFSIYVSDETDDDGWPAFFGDKENDEDCDKDIAGSLAKHLQDGCVAVLFQAGGIERFVPCGFAEAVNSKGESVHVRLHDIYDLAQRLGEEMIFDSGV